MVKWQVRSLIHCLLVFIAMGVFAESVTAETKSKQPNIIFIFADDWGYGDVGAHGSTFCKTPNIDRMIKEGIDFQQFMVTGSVCTPSRAGVITGQFAGRHHASLGYTSVSKNRQRNAADWLDPKAPMLPRMLQQAGYATAHFGKWHLTNINIPDAPSPLKYGYDEYAAHNLSGQQTVPEQMVVKTVDFIRRQNKKEKPFFVNLWLHATHTPHYAKPKYLKMFKHLNAQKKVYAAVVAEADDDIGQVLKLLKELKIDENTLVIFSSDNGPARTGKKSRFHNDPSTDGPNRPKGGLNTYYSTGETAGLKGGKGHLYAGGVRTPFVARWPGVVPAGKVNRTSILAAVDLLPTFLELAGQKLPKGYQPDGESIVSALKGKPFKRSKPIHWLQGLNKSRPTATAWPRLGICEGPWKLLYNDLNPNQPKVELYNIEKDWAEKVDVAAKNPNVVKALCKKIVEWEKTLPTKPPAHCFSKLRKELPSEQSPSKGKK